MSTSAASVSSWLELMQRQRVFVIGGVGVAAVFLLQFHRWYVERRHSNRRGRLKRSSRDDTTNTGTGTGTGTGRHSTLTRHPADMASTPSAGRDSSSLYPFEPLDDTSAAPSSCASHSASASASATPLSSHSTHPTDCTSSAPQPSSASSESSASHHTRETSVSNDVPREQMFYGLLSIIATVPTPHEAHMMASAHTQHTEVQPPAPVSSSSVPASTVATPRRTPALSYQHTSHSSDQLHPQHQSSSSLSLPPSAVCVATDKRLIKALHDKWQRQQRRRARRERRAARLAGQSDDASTASPSSSSVSSASVLGDDGDDDMADSMRHRLEYEYESGEEAADSYKRDELKQPVFLTSTASTATSSSTSSPTHSARSRSPAVSPLSLPSMSRSPQRLNAQSSVQRGRLDFSSATVQRHEKRTATHDEAEMKR